MGRPTGDQSEIVGRIPDHATQQSNTQPENGNLYFSRSNSNKRIIAKDTNVHGNVGTSYHGSTEQPITRSTVKAKGDFS
jgi:hypothetical protein